MIFFDDGYRCPKHLSVRTRKWYKTLIESMVLVKALGICMDSNPHPPVACVDEQEYQTTAASNAAEIISE